MKKKTVELKTYKVYGCDKRTGKFVGLFSLRSVSYDIALERIYLIFDNKIKQNFNYSVYDKIKVFANNSLVYESNFIQYLRKHALI